MGGCGQGEEKPFKMQLGETQSAATVSSYFKREAVAT